MNLCGETLREINVFMEYFFSSDLENTFYSEIEKENLVQFWWAEGTQTQNEIPLFFTRSWEMARFSILQHNFPFSWSICMELNIIKLVLLNSLENIAILYFFAELPAWW